MLLSLKIENFALIPQLELNFSPGFTVFTGETGSGKSILLGALNLILGERADYSVIRDAEQKTIVEGIFSVKNYELQAFFEDKDLDYSDEVCIRREITGHGKSRAFVNDTPVQLNVLKELSEQLIHIHSQHHTLELKNADFQFDVLDYLCDTMLLRKTFRKKNQFVRGLEKQLDEKRKLLQQLILDEDYSNFQLTELDRLNLRKTNYSRIEQELDQLKHFDTIQSNFEYLKGSLSGDDQLLEKMGKLQANLEKNKSLHSFFDHVSERIKSIYLELKDIAYETESMQEATELNPEQKAELEQNLSHFNAALFKHGKKTQEELLELLEYYEQQQSQSEHLSLEVEKMQQDIVLLKTELEQLGSELHNQRLSKKAAVEKAIVALLNELKMEHSQLEFELSKSEQANNHGFSKLSLNFSPNKGISPKPVEKAASGGELSRLMLAIQALLSEKKQLPGLIFDEIDTGVSGDVAQKLGELLHKMGKKMQLMAITHLPQVAAKGQSHFKVQKSTKDSSTVTEVISLNNDERITEIARLMSGENISTSALETAKTLMN